MHRPAGAEVAPADGILKRIALAAILAPEVEDQADEEQHEGVEDQQGNVDSGGEFKVHDGPFQIGNSLRPKRRWRGSLSTGVGSTSGPRHTSMASKSRISTPNT